MKRVLSLNAFGADCRHFGGRTPASPEFEQTSCRSEQQRENMEPAQESNHFSPGAKAEPHTSAASLNARHATEDPGCGNGTIRQPGIIALDEEQSASSLDNPMNDQMVICSFHECRDVTGAKIRRTGWRNGYHIAILYKRSHAAARCHESESCALLEHIL
jgi:hypothetical protein